MRQNYSGHRLSLISILFLMMIPFQNCSESGSDSAVSFASASLSTVVVNMKFNGGPGIYEGARLEFETDLDPDEYLLQWYYQSPGKEHGFPIDQANSNTYTIQNIRLDQEGLYWLAVTDRNGDRVISNKVTVEVNPSQLKTQPSNKVVGDGGNTQFVAEVRNGSDVSYRWEWKRPGKPDFEPVPANDAKITGAQDNVLLINGVEINKHVALYRLKITDIGSGGNDNRVFYSQQVHLTVLKTNLPTSKSGLAVDSNQTLTFEAVGVRRTGDGSVAKTTNADIRWERWDRNSDKFELIKSGDNPVTGSTLTFKASPRFTKYRARLLTKNNGSYYSRTTDMGYAGGYQEPWIQFMNVGSRIEYTKKSNGKYDLHNTPTFLRSQQSLHSSAVTGAHRRWHRKRPDDTAWVLVKNSDDNPYTDVNREIRGDWNDDTQYVEHRVYLQDKFGVRNYADSVAIHNGGSHPWVTMRIPVGTERNLLTSIVVRNTDGTAITDNHGVQITWQKQNESGGWDNMGDASATSKSIAMNAGSPDLRVYRVRYTNSKGSSGTLTNYHYFRIVKKQ